MNSIKQEFFQETNKAYFSPLTAHQKSIKDYPIPLFLNFPSELLIEIFDNLVWFSLTTYYLSITCKRFYKISERHPKLKLARILFQLTQSHSQPQASQLVNSFCELSLTENESLNTKDLKIFKKLIKKNKNRSWSRFLKHVTYLKPNTLNWIQTLMKHLFWNPEIVVKAKNNSIKKFAINIDYIINFYKSDVWNYKKLNSINWKYLISLDKLIIKNLFNSFSQQFFYTFLNNVKKLENLNENTFLALIKINQIFSNSLDRRQAMASIFEKLSEKKQNKEFILKACQQNGEALEFASENLQDDKEVVLVAVKQNGEALWHASIALKGDKEIALVATKQSGGAVEWIASYLNNDKDIILTAVKNFGLALKYASVELKNDKDVVLAAVKQDGMMLYYVSENLKDDKDVVLAAFKENKSAIKYASQKLKCDKEFIKIISDNSVGHGYFV